MCDATITDRLDSMDEFKETEGNIDIPGLMKLIQQLMTGANDKVHPGLQAVLAWNTFHWVRQQERESLLNCHKRFMSAVEHVEKVSGKICPDKMMPDAKKEEAREQFLACKFMMDANDGFAGLKKKCADDHARSAGSDYPVAVKEALAVLQTKHQQMAEQGKNGGNRLNFL